MRRGEPWVILNFRQNQIFEILTILICYMHSIYTSISFNKKLGQRLADSVGLRCKLSVDRAFL